MKPARAQPLRSGRGPEQLAEIAGRQQSHLAADVKRERRGRGVLELALQHLGHEGHARERLSQRIVKILADGLARG